MFHNVAQVPLAKDRALFDAVNVGGTANVLVARARRRCREGRAHVVERGVRDPRAQPGHRDDAVPAARGVRPGQAAGRAPVPRRGRRRARRHDRPAPHGPRSRPARHHGDRCSSSSPTARRCSCSATGATATSSCTPPISPTRACAPAGRPGPAVYNIGAVEFGTMRETLQALVDHAADRLARPVAPGRAGPGAHAMRASGLGLGPVRAVPLAALQRVVVLRRDEGAHRARTGSRCTRTRRW